MLGSTLPLSLKRPVLFVRSEVMLTLKTEAENWAAGLSQEAPLSVEKAECGRTGNPHVKEEDGAPRGRLAAVHVSVLFLVCFFLMRQGGDHSPGPAKTKPLIFLVSGLGASMGLRPALYRFCPV